MIVCEQAYAFDSKVKLWHVGLYMRLHVGSKFHCLKAHLGGKLLMQMRVELKRFVEFLHTYIAFPRHNMYMCAKTAIHGILKLKLQRKTCRMVQPMLQRPPRW